MGSKTKHQVRGESLLREQGCTDTTIGDQVGLFGNKAGAASHVSTKPAHYQAAQKGGSGLGRGPIVDFMLPDGRYAEVKFITTEISSVPFTTGTADHLNAVIAGCAASSNILTIVFTEIGEGLWRRDSYSPQALALAALSCDLNPVGDFDPKMTPAEVKAQPEGSIPWAGQFGKGKAPLQTIGVTTQDGGRLQAVDADGNPVTVEAKGAKTYVKGQGWVRPIVQKPVWARREDGSIAKTKLAYGMWRHNLSALKREGQVETTVVREDDLLAGI